MKKWMTSVAIIALIAQNSPIASANNDGTREAIVGQDNTVGNHWADVHMELVQKFKEDYKVPTSLIARKEAVELLASYVSLPDVEVPLIAKDLSSEENSYQAFQKLVHLGAIENAEEIRPNDYLTRAEMAKLTTILFNIEIDEKPTGTFQDVKSTHWAAKYINTLKDTQIVSGYSNNHYSPNKPIQIGEFAAIIDRALQLKHRIESHAIIYDFIRKDYLYTTHPYTALEKELIQKINSYRKSNGKEPLNYNPALSQLGMIKVNDMLTNKYFDHYSPTYNMPWELAGRFQYDFVTFGENLARGSNQASEILEAWIQSPKHRENLLNESFDNIGIGIERAKDGTMYYSNLFSGK